MDQPILDWLLQGDPAIRWQTQRDLLRAAPSIWSPIRSEVSSKGWGKRLLDQQDPQGTWAQGLYGPKWTSTTYTLLLLRRLGLQPSNTQAVKGTQILLDRGNWVDGGICLFSGRQFAERCVNGMVLALTSYFDVDDTRVDSIAEMLLASRMPDGGWNCEDHRGAMHSSFHTTISVLEGLAEWRRRSGLGDADAAIMSGQEFMLRHEMFRSHQTGEVINPAWTTFHFPPRWHYDVLRGLEHLRDAGFAADARAAGAIKIVRARRRNDGKWGKGTQYSGIVHFPLEPGRTPGRWNTLRAIRVLDWWNGDTP